MMQCEPFHDTNVTNPNYAWIREEKYDPFWALFRQTDKITDEFKDLIQKMLHFKEHSRITINDILEHKWYKGEIYEYKRRNCTFTTIVKSVYKRSSDAIDAAAKGKAKKRDKESNNYTSMNDTTRHAYNAIIDQSEFQISERYDIENPLVVMIGILCILCPFVSFPLLSLRKEKKLYYLFKLCLFKFDLICLFPLILLMLSVFDKYGSVFLC